MCDPQVRAAEPCTPDEMCSLLSKVVAERDAARAELAEVKNRLANRTSQHEQALTESRRFERDAEGWRKQWHKDTDRLEDRVERAEADAATAYQRGKVEGAREVVAAVEARWGEGQAEMLAVAREAVASIEEEGDEV